MVCRCQLWAFSTPLCCGFLATNSLLCRASLSLSLSPKEKAQDGRAGNLPSCTDLQVGLHKEVIMVVAMVQASSSHRPRQRRRGHPNQMQFPTEQENGNGS